MTKKSTERAAIYARVSTNLQHPEVQVDPMRSYCGHRGFEVVGEFVDKGWSGAKDRRPALDKLLAAVKKRHVDVVVCAKLDRLARSVRHLVDLAGEFEALGVDLVVVDQSIDTSTPSGRLLFHVLSSIAEFERDLIVERIHAGLRAARRRGAKLGRPRAVRDPKLLGRIRRLRKSGHSLRQIAALVGINSSIVHRLVKEGE